MEDYQKEAYVAYAQAKSNEFQIWDQAYFPKILKILQDKGINLTLESIPEIIEATSFRNLSIDPNLKEHCVCYREEQRPCHNQIQDLNCFLCACPNYNSGHIQITENGNQRILLGKCKRSSNKGKYFFHTKSPGVGMWDCSECAAYHHPQAVERYLRVHIKELQKRARETSN